MLPTNTANIGSQRPAVHAGIPAASDAANDTSLLSYASSPSAAVLAAPAKDHESNKSRSSRGGRALASLKRTASLFRLSVPKTLLPLRSQHDANNPMPASSNSKHHGRSQIRINQYILRHRYEIFKQVGDGSFGTVCLARQHGTQTGEYVR